MECVGERKGGEVASLECPYCHSKRTWKRGFRPSGFGLKQRYFCPDCESSFSEKSYKDNSDNSNHQLCALLRAKKLDSATETKTVAGENNGRLIEYAWHETKRGIADTTIAHRIFRLNVLKKEAQT